MKIIYLTSFNPFSAKNWSGTPRYMLESLKKQNIELITTGPIPSFSKTILKFYKLVRKFCNKDDYDYSYSKLISYEFALRLKLKINKIKDVDAIIAPAGSVQIAFLKTNIPILYLSDTTYDQLKNYYPNFRKLNSSCLQKGGFIERKALDNASIISFPSTWALDFCKDFYNIPNSKLKQILWGANINENGFCESNCYKNYKLGDTINILFIGVDWIRKGGHVAFEAVKHLRDSKKLNIKLIICGCQPDMNFIPEWVQVIGKLNKDKPEEYSLFNELLRKSNLLLLPTQAECYGMVFCEAAAYFLPVVATNTGGISSIVIDNETGILVKDPFDYVSFSEAMFEILKDEQSYQFYSSNAGIRYKKFLNWDVWAAQILETIYEYKAKSSL